MPESIAQPAAESPLRLAPLTVACLPCECTAYTLRVDRAIGASAVFSCNARRNFLNLFGAGGYFGTKYNLTINVEGCSYCVQNHANSIGMCCVP